MSAFRSLASSLNVSVVRAPAPVRRHVRECEECADFRSQVRSNEKLLAAMFPVPALFAFKGFIASKLGAYEFFAGSQARGLQVGIIYSPEEVMTDPHFVARGFAVEVEHPELGRSFTYPGAPYKFERSPWRISRRAPLLGEDQALLG